MQLGSAQVKQLLSMVGGGGQGGGVLSAVKNPMLNKVIGQVKQKFDANPTDECLEECTQEINGVLGRFSSLLGNDFSAITNLLR